MAEGDAPGAPPDALAPAARVEVRTGFDRSWTSGFVVEELTAAGYRLRRRSDGRILPTVFPFQDVRRERDNMWWM